MKQLTSQKQAIRDAMLQYIEKDQIVIPLNGKKALVSGWTEDDYHPTDDDVQKWFDQLGGKITGVALRTGYMEDLFVLDLEVEQDLSELDLPEQCVCAKSGRDGVHYYFSSIGEDSFDFTSTRLNKYGIEGDLKGNRGYIVAPPSIHPDTGKEYEWITPLGSYELFPAPGWLSEMIQKTKVEKETWDGVVSQPVEQGDRHNQAVRYTGKLLAHIPEKDWPEIVYSSLAIWNDTMCKPPLASTELNSIYSSLCAKQKSQRKKKKKDDSPVSLKPPMSVQEILEIPESERPEFLVQNIIPEKGITAIAGHPGCGKSWLMMEIARAVATGTNFLQHNEMQSKQTNVLIVDEESGVWEMRRRMELLQFSKKIPAHFYSLDQFKLDKEESISRLLDVCKEYDIGLIVFDPFASMHGGVENSAEEMQNVMGAMQKFNEAEVTVVFIHHHRKGGVGGNGLSLRGSSAILGRLDSLIVIEKTEDDVSQTITLKHVKSRRGKNAKSMKIAMVQPEEDAPIELLFSGEANETLLKKDRAKLLILELLKYEGLYKDEIVEAITEEDDIGERNIGQALIELVKEEKVTISKDDRRNHYKLNNLEKGVPV